MPCPYGLNIPVIFDHYNTCIIEDTLPKGNPEEKEYRRLRRAFLAGYDKKVPYERQASHCIGCGQCVVDCPQEINIPEELHRIDDFVEQLKLQGY